MFNKINTNNIISLILLLILVILAFGGIILIAIALMSALIVPLTFLWGLITGQSYDRVCDNSEFIYRLNQYGKWSLLIVFGIALMFLLFSI
jgi:hypothetical protein